MKGSIKGWLLVLLLSAPIVPQLAFAVCNCPSQFDLRVIGPSTMQIPLAWDAVPGASAYTVERSLTCDFSQPANCDVVSTPTCYKLSSFITAFGDTGKLPTDRNRFRRPSGLQNATTYYYRVRAKLPTGELISDCESAQLAPLPTRGVAGDLQADLVLGQPDFSQNEFRKTSAVGTQWAGGITVDKTRIPNRLYISDTNHNRVLGFDSIGHCANSTQCTSDADCPAGVCTLDHPNLTPQIVLGQPSVVDHAACNGDGTAQRYPDRAAATDATLCLIPPETLSIGESVSETSMEVDASGNLYVPDLFNNRVVRYASPLPGAGQSANGEWGQSSFAGNQANRGGTVSSNGLAFSTTGARAGVAVDHQGNLWVADPGNARVLRFPHTAIDTIASDADIVLGQTSCSGTVRGDSVSRPLTQFAYPSDVAVDTINRVLYVLDASFATTDTQRVIAYQLPVDLPQRPSCGVEPTLIGQAILTQQTPQMPFYCDVNGFGGMQPTALVIDSVSHGLWVENSCFFAEMFDLGTLQPVFRVQVLHMTGLDVDREGNLYASDKWYDTYRFRHSSLVANGLNFQSNTSARGIVYPGFRNPPTADAYYRNFGVTVFGSTPGSQQLISADYHRLLIWNNFDAGSFTSNGQPLTNGASAQDVFGEPDFVTETLSERYDYPQVTAGRFWIQLPAAGAVEAFEFPLRGSLSPGGPSIPSKKVYINVRSPAFTGYPLLGMPGQTIAAQDADLLDFAVGPSGNEMWVADTDRSRVFRINNLNGPGSPYVDVVLGQDDLTQTGCNKGVGAAGQIATSLCYPNGVLLDPEGNLYIADNGHEAGANQRIIEFDASRFAFKPGEVT
ncbi:MAG: hypothetical protein HY270_02355, partial [Deltaproteobacteria bacterium]|nr:hypothetical protein [Deltaproteobacteria bacterium]